MGRDVSATLDRYDLQYGGMGSTKQQATSVNRRLDYAAGNTIQSPVVELVSTTPAVLNFENVVGLFGAENTFVKVNLNIVSTAVTEQSFELSDGYFTAFVDRRAASGDAPDYLTTVIQDNLDLTTVNDYEPAIMTSSLGFAVNPVVSVTLENLKTGNIYIDNYLDMELYGPDRRTTGSDTIYVSTDGFFYIGFHARKTKRLPYKAKVTIGTEFLSELNLTDEQRRYLVKE